jgi:hemoglobin/transferrin/lactoferrin receptor protein
MKIFIKLAAGTLPLLFFIQNQLHSQEPAPTTDTLETVTVTAQRQSTAAFDSPAALSVLTQKQLETNESRSMAEALAGVPGVWMQKTNHGGGSPFVRGLTGNQTLLLLDGIRLNNTTYRYGPNQYFNTIDVLSVRQVEVLRGAGAVLYGSDAIGGTVQVLTKDARFSKEKTTVGGSVLGRWLSHDMEWGGRAELEVSGKNVALHGGFSYRDFGDLQAGGGLGVQAPSAYLERAGDFKMKAKLGKQSLLSLAWNGVFQSDVGRYDQVAQRGYKLWQLDPQNRQMAYARLESGMQQPFFDQIKVTAGYQNSLEGRQSQKTDSDLLTRERDEVNTLFFITEAHSVFSETWTAVSGAEVYIDEVRSTKTVENTTGGSRQESRGLYPDGATSSNLAVFTSHVFDWEKWQLNAGARFNFFDLKIEDEVFGNTSLQPTTLVGNASTIFKINPRNALTASVNTGFRAPNVNDLSSFGSFDFGVEVPSPGLSPERSLTFEMGYKMNGDRFFGNFSVYRTQLFDLIGRVPGTFNGSPVYEGDDVYQKANVDEAFVQGFEVDGQFDFFKKLSLVGHLVYTFGEDRSKNEPLRRIPPLNGRLALNFNPQKRLGASLEFLFAGKQDRLSGGDISDHRIAEGGTPGWSVFNLNLGYNGKRIQVNGGLQNIFNEAYRLHGSGVDGSGRHFWLAVKYRI